MSLTANNKTIGEVYFSSTKIGEIYKGNTLIYESVQDTSTPIPMYAYKNGYANAYIIGSQNTNGLLVYEGSCIRTKIKTITGTLGTSGSKITVKDLGSQITFTYSQTFNFNGINLCLYIYNYNTIYYPVFVRSDSSINSQVLRCVYSGEITLHPYKCDSTTLYPREEDYTYHFPFSYTNKVYSFGATKITAPL